FFMDRIFIASSAIVPLIVCIPLTRGIRWPWRILHIPLLLAMFVISAASIYAFGRYETKEDWRGLYAYVNTIPREQTLLVFCAPEGQLPFDYYDLIQSSASPAPKHFDRTSAPGGCFAIDPPRTVR